MMQSLFPREWDMIPLRPKKRFTSGMAPSLSYSDPFFPDEGSLRLPACFLSADLLLQPDFLIARMLFASQNGHYGSA